MPNTVDATETLLLVVRSGLVVSGNSYITCTRAINTGDALAQISVSGKTDLIAITHSRTETRGLTKGTYTEVAEYVDVHLYVHYPSISTTLVSGAHYRLEQMIDDFKVTVCSGSFTNPAPPVFVSEVCPLPHALAAECTLTYRFRYLL